jgi:hypothetical protein
MSFVHLVNRKYYQSQNKFTSGVQITVNKEIPMEDLTVVSLKCLLLENAGDTGEIREKCPKIQELDISETNIFDWKEVVAIVSQLEVIFIQQLAFLDISRLRFDLDSIQDLGEFKSLKSLVLGRSNLPGEKLRTISRTFPELVSLELRGSVLDLTSTFLDSAFAKLIKLNLAFCKLNDFSELLSLAQYENLAELKLCNNPIRNLRYDNGFLKLKKMNLEGTGLADLASVFLMNQFPALSEIRLGNTPLGERLGNHFRKVLIAYLPRATKLNGGYVEIKERNVQERQFIRDFSDPNNSSAHVNDNEYLYKLIGFGLLPEEHSPNSQVFSKLLEKHGAVYKFAEISLAPPTTANLIFETEDGRKEQKEVPLGWTVSNLKKLCQGLFGIPEKQQKLYYLDTEVPAYGMEPLRFDNKLLRTLKMKNEDLIKVCIKN